MSDKDIEEFKQELIDSIEYIQEGTGCSEGFSYTCFGEGDIEQALKIIEELETYKKIAEKINNLEALEQYAIDRNLFVKIFSPIYEFIWDERDYESDDFKFWSYADEYYILHKPSGTLVNWYKHLGRTNTCNKILSEEEYKTFVEMFTADWQEKR